ncbi:hypothetical protein N0V93_006613 [Gnomoniopsis smithogilvyi]|uniref:UFSP1/2/DUB catalytic domain-containing protein n=1 Tax=Gnomoniopsis smithogilvyi TaxID=1191159 RepID=A0A9W9CVS0_9PEZI|nr:hypothetical protein N0V93_006613 [Gnomoniopsis smithogilvyi]
MLMHMETNHPEGNSPFVPDDGALDTGLANPARDADNQDEASVAYVECPMEGCNEVVGRDEFEYHLELHGDEVEEDGAPAPPKSDQSTMPNQATPAAAASDIGGEEAHRTRSAKRRRSSPSRNGNASEDSEETAAHSRRKKAIFAWRDILSWPKHKSEGSDGTTSSSTGKGSVPSGPKEPKKLGKAELGRYANEEKMPEWLVTMLQKKGQVVGHDIVPVLRQLLQQSASTEYAYLCHPCVQHVSKLRREGGFCGYRNIQMMCSYILGTSFAGSHNNFGGKIPSIFDIQEFIEAAWDRGINKQGRVETGGVRGTRKYIGTPEAQAMLLHLAVPCEAQGFKNKKEAMRAETSMLVNVERYFQQGMFDPADKVRSTSLPPIYFQHAGHSMTIIGIEKMADGKANLLVFDPMFHDAQVITQRIGRKFKYKYADSALNAYRRGHKYLRRYREFEVLRLKPPANAVHED